jgi:hypothetical protein
MNCADYEIQIGEYVDGALDAPARQALEAHLSTCERCRRVAEDFRAIRAASLTLEPRVPPPHVWTRIAAAIDAEQPPRLWGIFGLQFGWRPLAAAAVALLVIAGVSWMAWRDLASPPAAPNATVAAAPPVSHEPVQPVEVELKLAEDQYVEAIAGLEQITKTGTTELDTETADVMQANLTVIDKAIGESRAALQTEPANDLAQESLFEALRNKVVLLQDTVALINEMRKGNAEGAARIVSGLNQ